MTTIVLDYKLAPIRSWQANGLNQGKAIQVGQKKSRMTKSCGDHLCKTKRLFIDKNKSELLGKSTFRAYDRTIGLAVAVVSSNEVELIVIG